MDQQKLEKSLSLFLLILLKSFKEFMREHVKRLAAWNNFLDKVFKIYDFSKKKTNLCVIIFFHFFSEDKKTHLRI